MRAFLGLGSNLGDRQAYLRQAVQSIDELTAVSRVYETEPVGGPENQGAYLNLVVQLETNWSPRELLGLCGLLEEAAQRVRKERFGPRTLDVDVLWIDGVEVNEIDLVVPHPRMLLRRFVQVPLLELAPDLADLAWDVDPDDEVVPHGDLFNHASPEPEPEPEPGNSQ
ncbi:MAG: 2-amino-4-hydroxy-6-hydroxymethyldihydropteridine diphosphokinase [Acidimicrobiia bacterium]